MSSCCQKDQRTEICPVNGKSYQRVDQKTLLHMVKQPWHNNIKDQAWYFCDSPDCDVVYFGPDSDYYTVADLRVPVAQKSASPNRVLCYCFDITAEDFKQKPTQTRDFVVQQTKAGNCACDIRNPSGRCCLKDFKDEQSNQT